MSIVWVFYLLLAAGVLAVVAWLVAEQLRHTRNLDRIPVRIMVNGIRGKSSVTRLTAGALRTQGRTVVAKTTGSAARFIAPDATETPIERRFGVVNVIEQVGVVRRAAELDTTFLVVECMAVQPDLQELNQNKLIRSTIGVITNVREDHVEEMGPTLPDIARSLSRSMPRGGVCFTTEREHFDVLAHEALRRNCMVVQVNPDNVTDAEMAGFGWVTFKENVVLALAVAGYLGVPRREALAGMYAAPPDPGVLRVERRRIGGAELDAVNLFAANDPQSTLMNVDLLNLDGRDVQVVINCRPDRMERNAQMGEIVSTIDPSQVYLIGSPTRSALRAISPSHQPRVVDLGGEDHTGPALLEHMATRLRPATTLLMIGNIHGRGEHLLDALGMGSVN
ncbi:poly-gamma-glutamate synthase PgsB [Actinomadura sp. DC4]|uniref:poly-gamma-glutamate synthase PgsB n=1 Tax=Actinomadura sp. DC4 TaxID=3055069 RepID=UPI0025B1ABEB|nr:poly-gamma-glutamate synthase PgsB [Actinomadura sp. DC4]MDN3357193.1 poly-gamma-glutamate synthase PgsB [Actinomadura sp. DC4]